VNGGLALAWQAETPVPNGRRTGSPKQKKQREAEATDAAGKRLMDMCPKCGCKDVMHIAVFNPIHSNGVYCNGCGRHSFPESP
jgi:hypothetical protein